MSERLHPDDIRAIAEQIADEVAEILGLRAPAPSRATTSIYALCDPDTGAIHYVGRSVDPEARLSVHLSFDRSAAFLSAKERWIVELQRAEKSPVLRVLAENIPRQSERAAEARWIRWALAQGAPLTNTAKP